MEDTARATFRGRHAELAGRTLILLGAFISFVLSVSLWFTGNHEQAIFVGLWVPSILALANLVPDGAR
jgi:formate hydrogenlyase subunit 3/multisubunit Na+/H+ antiporter MnhD subunit